MKSITIKKLYKLHTWVGIISGILLFVIAFTGAVAVFARPELKIWANDEIRSPVQSTPQQIEAVIEEYANTLDPIYREEVHVNLPDPRYTQFLRVIYEGHIKQEDGSEKHEGFVYLFDPNSLALVHKEDMMSFFNSDDGHDIATFIGSFHADLHLGRPVGLILTGLLGLTLMVSIVTGILVHRKKLGQLFTFRPTKSFSLLLNDGHKVMGIWAVAFHSVIAFTGAFLGLATVILLPAAAYVSFNGDQEALVETFTAMKPPELAHVAQPTKIADILEKSVADNPELVFSNFSVLGYGDQNAIVYLSGAGDENLGGQTLIYQGATAEYQYRQSNFGRLEGVTGKILDVMFPLHFGNFGGIFVKALWAWLGLALALLPITGMMLWVERGITSNNPAHSPRTYEGVSRLLTGSCCGIVLATAVLFPTQLILNSVMATSDHTTVIFSVFFTTWGLATALGLAIKASRGFSLLSYATVISLMLVMPMDIALTGSHLFNLASTQHYVSVTVDITLFILGAAGFVALRKQATNNTQAERNPSSKPAMGSQL